MAKSQPDQVCQRKRERLAMHLLHKSCGCEMCVLCVSGRGRERQSPRCMHEQRTTAEEFTMLTGEEEEKRRRRTRIPEKRQDWEREIEKIKRERESRDPREIRCRDSSGGRKSAMRRRRKTARGCYIWVYTEYIREDIYQDNQESNEYSYSC